MNDGAQIALYALMLALPLSALLARRLPLGQVVRTVLAWIAIFGLVTIVMAQRHRLRPLIAGLGLGDGAHIAGTALTIARSEDGHFYVDATIDGVARRMLVDSGATTTALSAGTARAAGIALDDSTFPRIIETANSDVLARTATIRRLTIGRMTAHDLPIVVLDGPGDQDVLGMNFLSRLESWRVEGGMLTLQPTSK